LVGDSVGRVTAAPQYHERYVDGVVATVDSRLEGIRVALDCANGAASEVAPEALRRLGAEVIVLHDRPNGTNINDGCGSTHPQELQRVVAAAGADAGLAFDGDADRVIAVDASGQLVDGDQIVAMCALDLRERGRLVDDTVVITVMTNLGFRLAMKELGIQVVETAVGDRYVLDALDEGGWVLGGEQSGHVIFRDLATTGDGLMTGLRVLDIMVRTGRPLAELAGVMRRLPQVLMNVRVESGAAEVAAAMAPDVAAAEAELGETGRVLVRPSGTEPLVRVMVEAETEDRAHSVAGRLVDVVERLTG
jgi:phosphoglucosamine mutase